MTITLKSNGTTYDTDHINQRIKDREYLKTTTDRPEALAYYDWQNAEDEAILAAIKAQLLAEKYCAAFEAAR